MQSSRSSWLIRWVLIHRWKSTKKRNNMAHIFLLHVNINRCLHFFSEKPTSFICLLLVEVSCCCRSACSSITAHPPTAAASVCVLHQAGSQLELLSEQKVDGALLQACLHVLCVLYTSLKARNPLRRAVGR